MRFVLDNDVTVARLGRNFHRARGFRRRLIFIDLDAVAFKCCKQVVDFFRGMHFGWKGIVYFVIEQVAALFADSNELAYRIVFFFETDYSHKFLPQSDGYAVANCQPHLQITRTR